MDQKEYEKKLWTHGAFTTILITRQPKHILHVNPPNMNLKLNPTYFHNDQKHLSINRVNSIHPKEQ